MADAAVSDETFITEQSTTHPDALDNADNTVANYTAVLGDITRLLEQPPDERLANMQRFSRCVTVRFRRRQASQEEIDLQRLMPAMLARNQEVWEYTSCAICLVDFGDGEELRRTPCAGGHAFHPKCLRGWLERSHVTCPVCRDTVERRSSSGPSSEQLADFVMRRIRSGKVDFSISENNQKKAARVMRRMRDPMPTGGLLEEEEEKEESDEKQPAAAGDKVLALPAPPPEVANSTLPDIFAAHILARSAEKASAGGC